jgi:hypothetical protein
MLAVYEPEGEADMILPGHLAAAYLAGRLCNSDWRGAMAAAMFPDLIDKPLRWLLRRTPNDRIPAHTGLAWALTTAAARRWGGTDYARGWLVGYGAHLVCDEVNAHLNPGRIYFLWPFRRYTMHVGPTGLKSSLNDFRPASLAVEGAIVALAAAVWLAAGARDRRARPPTCATTGTP